MSVFKCVIQDIDFLNIKFDFLENYDLITSIRHIKNPHTKEFCRLNFSSTNLSLLIFLQWRTCCCKISNFELFYFESIGWQCLCFKIYDLLVQEWSLLVATDFPHRFWISIGLKTA